MATVNVVLRTDKNADKNGEYPVYIRVYHKKPIYYSTGVKIEEEDWNERSGTVRATNDKHAVYNSIIDDEYTRIDNTIIRLERKYRNLTPEQVKKAIQQPEEKTDRKIDFIEYAEQWLEQTEHQHSPSYMASLNNSYQEFKKFTDGYIRFKDITVPLLRRYKRYIINEVGNSEPTSAIKISFISRIFNEAIRDGVASQADNPFFVYEIEKGKPKQKTFLNLKEIGKIASLDLPKGSNLWHVRNAFLLSFWCAGIRVSDLCMLDWVKDINNWGGDNPELDYTMKKNGKRRVLPILPPAIDILSHYEPKIKKIRGHNLVFPFIPARSMDNDRLLYLSITQATKDNNNKLKVIAEMAGIDKHITNHTSRHSFAACFEEMELPVEALQELLAHSDMKTTESYRKKLGVAVTKRSRKSLNEFFAQYQKAQNG